MDFCNLTVTNILELIEEKEEFIAAYKGDNIERHYKDLEEMYKILDKKNKNGRELIDKKI